MIKTSSRIFPSEVIHCNGVLLFMHAFLYGTRNRKKVVPVSNFMHMNMHGNGSGRNCTDYTGRNLHRLALIRQS